MQNGWPIRIMHLHYREAGADYAVARHTHNFYQWYFVLHGRVDSRVGDRDFRLNAEDSMLVSPGIARDRRAVDKAPGYLVAAFENHSLDLTYALDKILCLPEDLRPDVHALIAEVRTPSPTNAEPLVVALLVRILIGLRRHHLQNLEHTVPKPSSALNAVRRQELVAQVETYIRRNLHNSLTRNEIASFINLSPPHLARVFRQTTGSTLGQRLIELRLERAKALLLESTVPITTIAGDVGYNSFSHFTQQFKAHVGVSPSDYRRTGGQAWSQPGLVSAGQ